MSNDRPAKCAVVCGEFRPPAKQQGNSSAANHEQRYERYRNKAEYVGRISRDFTDQRAVFLERLQVIENAECENLSRENG